MSRNTNLIIMPRVYLRLFIVFGGCVPLNGALRSSAYLRYDFSETDAN